MPSINCNRFSTLDGNGCCTVVLDDTDKIQLLSYQSILRTVTLISRIQSEMRSNSACILGESKISCNGLVHVASVSDISTSNTDLFHVKRRSVETLLSGWIRRQRNRYSENLLECMALYCIIIMHAPNLSSIEQIIDTLKTKVSELQEHQ